jgi:DNA replication protein DnaC
MVCSVSFIFSFSDFDVQAQFSVNQSRPEEITMTEDLSSITFVGDDGFGKAVTVVVNLYQLIGGARSTFFTVYHWLEK